MSQTSPTPRFEVGGGITGIRNIFVADVGPTVEGDVNFGRHVALDAGQDLSALLTLFGEPRSIRIQGKNPSDSDD
jgi:hypothetical protein